MRKAIIFIVVWIAIGGAVLGDIDYATLDPVTEVRGVWIDAGAIPKTAGGIRQMVRSYYRANFNLLLPETICRGYAIYPSVIIGRDPRFAGAIDPLPVMIDEAHKLGMEVHPWVWVFRAGYARDKGSILCAHPDWAELDRDGCDLSPNGGYWISPANTQATDYLACLYAELATKYDIDGLHLDYIRYEVESKKPYGFAKPSVDLFERQYGVDPATIQAATLDQVFWNKFRERQVNTFVQRISLQTKRIRPGALISAAVGSYPPDARLELLQNWPNWVANKWVDFVTPMSYSTDDAYFGRLIFRQKEAVDCNTLLAEGVGMFMHKDTAQTSAQIGVARRMLAQGQVMFAASYCGAKQLDALRCGAYRSPVLLPFRNTADAVCLLRSKASISRAQGCVEMSDYYTRAADCLGEYAAYRARTTPYIVPSAPPLR